MKKNAYKEMYLNELDHAWYKQTRELLIDNLEKYLKKNARILDAGSGTGGTIHRLTQYGFKNIFGIDISSTALSYSRKRGINSIRIGSINSLPYKNNSFDAVICMDVLYHKGVNQKQAINEISRVLKKEGILYVQEPAYNWLKSKHDLAIETQTRFTKKTLSKMLQNGKFKIEKATYYNMFFLGPIIIKRIKDKILKNSSNSSDVKHLTPILNAFMDLALSLERKILKKFTLPAGLSIVCICKK